MDAEKRPLRTPKLGPDLESPTHRPRPSDLRRENRKGIGAQGNSGQVISAASVLTVTVVAVPVVLAVRAPSADCPRRRHL